MTDKQPALLHICEQAWDDVKPRAAHVHVTLTASKLFSGRAALTKSEELRKLVESLVERRVPESAVALCGAALDVSTGLFTRSSSVTYRVRIHVEDLELVAAVLDAIATSKQARLTHITWDHTNGTGAELLAECAARAAAKAQRLAASLGVTLAGVHEVHEEELADTMPVQQHLALDSMASMMVARKRSIDSELAGLELAPTKQIGVRVRVAYRISPDSRSAP